MHAKTLILLLSCVAASLFSRTAAADDDVRDYWRRHWSWYDESYRPYFHRQHQYSTPIGGGSYHADPDLRTPLYTAPGGGTYHPDRSLRSPTHTPIGGGTYHAPRSAYDRPSGGIYERRAVRPAPGYSYGWW